MKRIIILLFIMLNPSVSFGSIIKLNNGDTLNVIIKEQTKDALIVEHDSLGSLTIEKVKIANLQSIDQQTIKRVESEATAEDQVIDNGLFGTGWLVGWKRQIDVGLNGASGSSNDTSFRTSISGYYEDDAERWDFKSTYLYKQEDNETTDNDLKTDLLKDWFISESPWFYFAKLGFDMDEFKDWDYRFRLATGPGYQLFKTKKLEFSIRFGLNGVYEIHDSNNVTNLEGLIGFNFIRNFSDSQSVRLRNTFYPSATDSGEYRNVTAFEWNHKLDFSKGLSIKFGFDNEYDTDETDKNDLKYYAAIGWEL